VKCHKLTTWLTFSGKFLLDRGIRFRHSIMSWGLHMVHRPCVWDACLIGKATLQQLITDTYLDIERVRTTRQSHHHSHRIHHTNDDDLYSVDWNTATHSHHMDLSDTHIHTELLLTTSVLLLTCHMGSHSVTCHLTQVNAPRHNPTKPGRYLIYLPETDGRPSWTR